MSWPPQEKELESDKMEHYVPRLLDIFYTAVLISGKSVEDNCSKVERVIRLKDSFCSRRNLCRV